MQLFFASFKTRVNIAATYIRFFFESVFVTKCHFFFESKKKFFFSFFLTQKKMKIFSFFFIQKNRCICFSLSLRFFSPVEIEDLLFSVRENFESKKSSHLLFTFSEIFLVRKNRRFPFLPLH